MSGPPSHAHAHTPHHTHHTHHSQIDPRYHVLYVPCPRAEAGAGIAGASVGASVNAYDAGAGGGAGSVDVGMGSPDRNSHNSNSSSSSASGEGYPKFIIQYLIPASDPHAHAHSPPTAGGDDDEGDGRANWLDKFEVIRRCVVLRFVCVCVCV